jgi:L,D-transpeptidase ErfK/SrfK
MAIPAIRTVGLLACLVGLLVATSGSQAADGTAGDLIGTARVHVVAPGETLLEIARHYDLGFVELRAANPGVDPWIPPRGLELALPTVQVLPEAPRRGIVINLAEQRLYHFPAVGAIVTYPIGTGRQGWMTPLGQTRVVDKRANPVWVPPASIRAERPDLPAAVPPGPANPLGRYALDLGWEGFVIHGTNRPYGVGRRVSHGCIRLYPEDIEALFNRVAVGTPVTVIDQPVKIGRSDGELYLEVHPTQTQADEIEACGRFTPERVARLERRILDAAGADTPRLDWALIEQITRERRGIPVRVTRPAGRRGAPSQVLSDYLRSD